MNFLRYKSQITVLEKQNREDSVIVPTHYLLLEILSQYANRLIFSIYNELYRCKETNWKQKKEKTPRMQIRDNKN